MVQSTKLRFMGFLYPNSVAVLATGFSKFIKNFLFLLGGGNKTRFIFFLFLILNVSAFSEPTMLWEHKEEAQIYGDDNSDDIAISPNDKYVVVSYYYKNPNDGIKVRTKLLDIKTGEVIHTFENEVFIEFSKNGKILINLDLAEEETPKVVFYDASTLKEVNKFIDGGSSSSYDMQYACILVGEKVGEKTGVEIRRYDNSSNFIEVKDKISQVVPENIKTNVISARFHPRRNEILMEVRYTRRYSIPPLERGDSYILVYDVELDSIIKIYPHCCYPVYIDERRLAFARNVRSRVYIIDYDSGETLYGNHFEGMPYNHDGRYFEFSKDGNYIYIYEYGSHLLRIYDFRKPEAEALLSSFYIGGVGVYLSHHPAISSDRRYIAVGSNWNTIRLFADNTTIVAGEEYSDLLYPNPSNNSITLDNLECGNVAVSIFNSSGVEVSNRTYQVTEGKIMQDISFLPSGTYFLIVSTADNPSKTYKFVKE